MVQELNYLVATNLWYIEFTKLIVRKTREVIDLKIHTKASNLDNGASQDMTVIIPTFAETGKEVSMESLQVEDALLSWHQSASYRLLHKELAHIMKPKYLF